MMKFIPFILPVCLVIAFSTVTIEKAFSQKEPEYKPDGSPAYVKGLTSGRMRSLVGGVMGIISLVVGWRAKNRSSANPGSGRSLAIASLILGVVAIVLSIVHLANLTGGFGTGGGKAGAIVGLLLGLVGVMLSGMVLRSNKEG